MSIRNALCVAVIFFMGVSTATAMTVISQLSVSVPVQATPWGPVTVTLPQFDQSMFPNYELQEVCFTLDGVADSHVDVTAIENTNIVEGDVGAFIQATNFSTGSLSLNAIPSGTFAPPVLALSATDVMSFDLTGTDSDSLLLNSGLAPYIGTGTVTADLSAVGTNSSRTAGGNFELVQETTASATLTIEYKGVLVPEPSSSLLALAGLGIFLGIARRK